jgi:gamma-carbonic anhydrase
MLLPYRDSAPDVAADAYVAPGAVLSGDVRLGEKVSIWFGCVLRGDVVHIRIGAGSNIQDLSVVHGTGPNDHAIVGQDVTVGHRAIIHGCTIEDGCLIGMGATVMDGARIGEGSLVGAGALVTPRTVVPPRSLVLGAPAKVVRPINAREAEMAAFSAAHYVQLAAEYRVATGPCPTTGKQ